MQRTEQRHLEIEQTDQGTRCLHHSPNAASGMPLPYNGVMRYSRIWEGHPLAGALVPKCILSLCILASLLLFPLSASAHALANNGRITGQLLDGTKKNAPLAGQQVTLQEAQGTNSRDAATVTTDAHGNYSFANLATDKTINYAVYMEYQKAQYVSDIISFSDGKPVQQVNLTVYDATNSTAKIAILQNTILLHSPDPQKGVINVSEILTFQNLDSRTYVGSFDTSKGKPNALRFSLPGNAKNINLGTGFDGYNIVQVDLGFATNAVIPPGTTQFSFSYQIAYSAASYDFRYVNVYPTVELSLLVPPSLQVDPGFLTSAGITNSGNDSYRLYKAEGLLSGDEVHASLAGLPTPTFTNSTPDNVLNTNIIWFIVGGIILLAIIAIVGYLSNLRRKKTFRKRGKQTKAVTNSTAKSQHIKEQGSASAKDKEDALLRELLALDKAFESGKISKNVYNERRARTKARLRSLMSEQEATRR